MRPVHGGCWWAPVLAVVAVVLWAGPAGAETTIAVEAGYAGSFVPGREVPVRVRVSADRLVRGSLEVTVGRGENGVPVAMAVEVPGGSQKEFLVTTRAGLNQNPEVVARLRQDDQLLASGQTSVRATTDSETVGLLPGALRGRAVPGAAPLAVDAGTARFAAVGEAELEQAPSSLGPLSTLAADADELSRLSPAALAGVLRWMADGGRLLVDTAKGQAVAGLPDVWQPGVRGRAAAGLGEVVATDGAIAAGRWAGLVEPTGWSTVSSRFDGDMPLASSLASDAGLRTPELRWLVGFLAVYVLAVGPLLFLGVRRLGRPELAWVAVPLVAVLFSTGSYAVGRNLRKATRMVHGSILSTGPLGPTATTYVGVLSRGGGTARIGFPTGWSGGPFTDVAQSASAPSLVTRTPEGPEARLPLEAGQFGVVHGTGPARGAGALEITAQGGPAGEVKGTVRNTTPFPLDEMVVFLGGNATVLGALQPGEEAPFSVVPTRRARVDGPGPEFRAWGGLTQGGPEAVADFGLWQAALRAGGPSFMAPGAVIAAGWTREFVPEVRVDGRPARPEGRTLVFGRQQVDAPADARLEMTVRRDVVRDPFASRFGPPGPRSMSVVRFVLPHGADTSKLVLKSPFMSAELWQDGGWKAAACHDSRCPAPDLGGGPPDCQPGFPCRVPMMGVTGETDFTVPPATVQDGVVWVRVPGPASFEQQVPLTIARSA